ncbi:MAG: glycosyltransferase family 39 protein [Chitinophagales bacterium]|nr:glycosyltransferase family 39 protein [Chitinophagales bacterium]
MASSQTRYIIIALAAACLFFPFLGQVHLFDWDEINFAECAREMMVTNNYLQVQIDYQPFWEKPPVFIWMQVLAMKLFGVNEYAARFPNAFIGVVTLLTLFYAGKRVVNEKMATWWVALYAATWLPHFYFKSGIIDPTFNLFIFLAFFQVYLIRHGNRPWLHAVLSGVFLGMAVLTKGPAAILIALLAFGVYVIINRGIKGFKWLHFPVIAVMAFITTCIWFGLEVLNHGWWMVNEFITYQVRLFQTEDAGHGGPFFYHFIILLLGCFPASVFLFHKSTTNEEVQVKDFKRWMWVLFWVVLILFSIVKTKIVHYSSMCYFPLTFIAALHIHNIVSGKENAGSVVKILLGIIGSLLALAITLFPVVGLYKDKLIPYIKDPFAVANLQADVSWSAAETLWGIFYLVGIIAAVVLMSKNIRRGIIVLFAVQIVIIQVTVLHFTPKIEAYSQRAAIEFFESLEGKDVYVKVLGYKSYAHLFYTKRMPQANPNHYNEEWLLYGDVDKPTYFICKIMNADAYRTLPQLEEIGSKNGFVFFKRK